MEFRKVDKQWKRIFTKFHWRSRTEKEKLEAYFEMKELLDNNPEYLAYIKSIITQPLLLNIYTCGVC